MPRATAGAGPDAASGATAMCLPRVVYTRVEQRDNPDYQILGRSPESAALASTEQLESFFRSLVGQPDTLQGFGRAAWFAPLTAPVDEAHLTGSTDTVWIAGVTRPSDKPDRYGRRGILNHSAVMLTAEQVAKLGYDPWPLFDRADDACPFIDTPDHAFDAWDCPPACSSAARLDPQSVADDGTTDAIWKQLQGGSVALVTPFSGMHSHGDLEPVLRSLYLSLPVQLRRHVPLLTWSFRPLTSAARFRLIGASADAPSGDRRWRPMVGGWSAPPGGLAVDVRIRPAHGERIAVSVPTSRASQAGGNASGRLRQVIAGIGMALLVAVGVLVFALRSPEPASDAPAGLTPVPLLPRPGGDNRANPPDTAPDNSDPFADYSLPALAERWQQTGAWRGNLADPDVATRVADFVKELDAVRESRWGHIPPAAWPSSLQRLSAQLALVQWRLAGRSDAELHMEFTVRVEAHRLDVWGPVELTLTQREREPDRQLAVPIVMRFPWLRPEDVPSAVETRKLPQLPVRPDSVLRVGGRVRTNDLSPQSVGGSLPIPSPEQALDDPGHPHATVLNDPDGAVLTVELTEVKIVARQPDNGGFPTFFLRLDSID